MMCPDGVGEDGRSLGDTDSSFSSDDVGASFSPDAAGASFSPDDASFSVAAAFLRLSTVCRALPNFSFQALLKSASGSFRWEVAYAVIERT